MAGVSQTRRERKNAEEESFWKREGGRELQIRSENMSAVTKNELFREDQKKSAHEKRRTSEGF